MATNLLDKVVLELDADITGNSTEDSGVFEIEKDLTIDHTVTVDPLLDQSGDRILGAIPNVPDGEPNRQGITLDVGGGTNEYRIQFKAIDGGTNQWGDNTGNDKADATGDSARRKKDVLMRYL
jgi:hypothetical protein